MLEFMIYKISLLVVLFQLWVLPFLLYGWVGLSTTWLMLYCSCSLFITVLGYIIYQKKHQFLHTIMSSEHKFRLYVEDSPNGVFVANKKGKYIYANESACLLLGYSNEELLSMSIPDVAADDAALKSFEDLQLYGKASLEVVCKHKNGKLITLHLDAIKLEDETFIAYCRDITEKKKTEEELIKSRNKYGSLFKHMISGVAHHKILLDEDGKPIDYIFIDVNEAYEEMTGLKKENILEKRVTDVFPSILGSDFNWIELYGSIALGADPRKFDVFTPLTNHWYSISVYSPEKLYFTVVMDDITEKKLADDEVKKFKCIADLANYGIFLTDLNKNIIYINPYLSTLLDVSTEEVLEKSFIEAFSVQSSDQLDYLFNKVKQSKSVNSFEFVERTKKGTTLNLLFNAILAERNAPNASFIAFTLLDVKEYKSLEKQKQAFMDALPDIAWLKDNNNRYISVNNTFEDTFGVKSYQVIGKTSEEIFDEQLSQKFKKEDLLVINAGESCTFKDVYSNKEDKLYWLETARTPIYDEVNNFIGLLGISRDITEQKSLQEELEEQRNSLEKLVEVKTKQLRDSLKALEKTNSELEVANTLKNKFLSSMSHELRTPLNAIIGFTELLQMQYYGDLNEQQIGYVEHILYGATHLLSLVNDLLDISKIDAGMLDITCQEFVIEGVISSVVNMLKAKLDEKRIKTEIQIGESVKIVSSDIKRVKQILLNLLSNAIKYEPDGGCLKITVKTLTSTLIEVSIQDHGVGIAEAEKENIFNEFYQVNKFRDQNLGGTGIGLALTKRLVALLNGTIGVDSEPNKGCRFYFTLPIHPNIDNTEEKCPTDQPILTTDSFKQPKILVVDDNKINLSLLVEFLSEFKADCIVANNGKEAIELISAFMPDLIFMDIRMPEIDGIDAIKEIRKFDHTNKLPIIAMTAPATLYEHTHYLKLGFNEHFEKPLDRHSIKYILEKYLIKQSL